MKFFDRRAVFRGRGC